MIDEKLCDEFEHRLKGHRYIRGRVQKKLDKRNIDEVMKIFKKMFL